MRRHQANSDSKSKGHPWRNGALSATVVGAIVAVMLYSARSPARQERETQPSSRGTAFSAEVRDCLRVKRIELVDEAGRTVGILQGVDLNVGQADDSFGMLELYGHGTKAGHFVRVDPQRAMISGNGRYANFSAACAEWAVSAPTGPDEVMVRISATSKGGCLHVKPSDATAPVNTSAPHVSVKDEWSWPCAAPRATSAR
jgi:hypothetical protein